MKESTPGLFYITVRIENTTDTVMEIPFDIRLAYLEERDGAYYTSGALKAKVAPFMSTRQYLFKSGKVLYNI